MFGTSHWVQCPLIFHWVAFTISMKSFFNEAPPVIKNDHLSLKWKLRERNMRGEKRKNWPTRLPSMSGHAASCLQLAAVTEPPYRILKWDIYSCHSFHRNWWKRLMLLFSTSKHLVDSATAGDTLEDNQPLSARCTSCSGKKLEKVKNITFPGHLGLLWSGSLACANCPNRFIGNHHLQAFKMRF